MKTIFATCPEHFGCVRIEDGDSVRHEPADRDAKAAIDGTRGTIAQAKAEQDQLREELKRLRGRQEELTLATEHAKTTAAEAEHEQRGLRDGVIELDSLLVRIRSQQLEIEAACVALLTRAQDEVKRTQALLREREDDMQRRYRDFESQAEETMGALEDKLAEVQTAERLVIGRAKEGLKRVATDREFFQRALDQLVRSTADVVERAKRKIT